ncbi:outer membrane beta-barrel protein [Geotalea sp. SG265]|uniref:outer membrane protein n=1 Tax=Geotalea sp. SG265 TaxID=2922867 RepID=UPI001FAFD930|nr:outer membrane beta-barrel protein [Geotalea sp. SG265]
MKRRLKLLAITCILLLPALSWSASIRPGAYVSGFIGASVPRSTNVDSSQLAADGSFLSARDEVEFDPGINIGGTGGYDFGFLRLEGELSYKHSEINTITDRADGFRFGNPDGNIGVFAMMGNAFFDLHNKGPVAPYLGGGIGFANLHLSDTFGTDITSNGPERVFLYPEDDDTVFAYQAGAGVGIALNRRLTLDIGYRYFGTSRARFSDGLDTAEFRYESHNAAVGVRVKF